LLGQRAAALSDVAFREVHPQGARRAAPVHPAVLPEAAILFGNRGVDKVLGNLFQRGGFAILFGDTRQLHPVRRVDETRLARLVGLDRAHGGHHLRHLVIQHPCEGHPAQQEYQK